MIYNEGIRSCRSRLTSPRLGGLRMPLNDSMSAGTAQRSFIAKDNWVEIHCVVCNKQFWVVPAIARRGSRFCTHACAGVWRSKNQRGAEHGKWAGEHNHSCPQCGKVFRATPKCNRDPKFCSRNCLAAWKSTHWSGTNSPYWNRIEKPCCICGKIILCKPSREKGIFTCSIKCRSVLVSRQFSGEGNPSWCGGLSRFPYPIKFNPALKRKIRDRDGHICTLCHKTEEENGENLSIHHIDYDKDNCDETNLTSVCRSCNARVNANREMWTRHFQKAMVNL
jgi:hypothetical protein